MFSFVTFCFWWIFGFVTGQSTQLKESHLSFSSEGKQMDPFTIDFLQSTRRTPSINHPPYLITTGYQLKYLNLFQVLEIWTTKYQSLMRNWFVLIESKLNKVIDKLPNKLNMHKWQFFRRKHGNSRNLVYKEIKIVIFGQFKHKISQIFFNE